MTVCGKLVQGGGGGVGRGGRSGVGNVTVSETQSKSARCNRYETGLPAELG